jgi:anti-anti-sigma factor
MSPDLRCVLERDAPSAVLRLIGTLHADSVAAVRAAIEQCVTTRAHTVIVDLSGLRVDDAAALTVFADVARDTAQWPGAPLLLCSPNAEVAAALDRSRQCRFVPVFPTLEAAMAGSENQMVPHQLSSRLLPAVGAARQARELVTEACARWDLPELVGPACTIVTELVNNVVVHARTPMEVVLRLHDSYLNISVRDESATSPEPRGPASPTAPGGRGLMMVEAVAQRWGHTAVPGGKVVWAVLSTEDVTAY